MTETKPEWIDNLPMRNRDCPRFFDCDEPESLGDMCPAAVRNLVAEVEAVTNDLRLLNDVCSLPHLVTLRARLLAAIGKEKK